MCVCAHLCAGVYVYMWRTDVNFGYLARSLYTFYLDFWARPLSEPAHLIYPDWMTCKPSYAPVSTSQCRDTGVHCHALLSIQTPRLRLRSSCLQGKNLISWTLTLVP